MTPSDRCRCHHQRVLGVKAQSSDFAGTDLWLSSGYRGAADIESSSLAGRGRAVLDPHRPRMFMDLVTAMLRLVSFRAEAPVTSDDASKRRSDAKAAEQRTLTTLNLGTGAKNDARNRSRTPGTRECRVYVVPEDSSEPHRPSCVLWSGRCDP